MVFIAGRRANALQITARQCRFQHVGGIHGALRSPCPNNGMQFIDKQDDFTVGFLDLFNCVLKALLKFSSEARAGNHGSKIK